MWHIASSIVLLCAVSSGKSFPLAAPPIIPPVVAPVAPILPTAYPYGATSTSLVPAVAGYRNPLVPGVAGYRNPLLPGVAGYNNPLVSGVAGYNSPLVPGVAGYNNPLVPGAAGYHNPLVPGVAGYNNPYYNQYRTPGAAVPILTYSSEHTGDGAYSFSFTTADGKQAQEAGYLKDAYIDNSGEPQGTQVVQGSYAYISPEGTPIQVSYIADENGFRPSGVHIPADGKAVVPVIHDKEKQILDPLYNRYDPFNRNRYNAIGKYNRPYDPRYNYNNPYLNNQYLAPEGLNKNSKDTPKKTA